LLCKKRFWDKVQKTDTCWLWTASKTRKGYGQFALNGKMVSAHRLSYEDTFGPIPTGLKLDHTCHVKHCVKPQHLQPATTKKNAENLKGAHKDNLTGVRGVAWDKATGKWRASVCHNYKSHWLGRFDTLDEAEAAVISKRNELFTNNLIDRTN
jgi:hypothetical protein